MKQVFCLITVWCVLSLSVTVQAVEKKQSSYVEKEAKSKTLTGKSIQSKSSGSDTLIEKKIQKRPSTQIAPKIKTYLERFNRFMNFDQSVTAFKAMKLNKKEINQLTTALKSTRYKNKMRKLTNTPKISAEKFVAKLIKASEQGSKNRKGVSKKPGTPSRKKAIEAKINSTKTKIKRDIDTKNRQRVQQINKKANTALVAARSLSSQAQNSLRMETLPQRATVRATDRVNREEMANIDHTNPDNAVPGQEIVLWGNNLGTSGQAFLRIDDMIISLTVNRGVE